MSLKLYTGITFFLDGNKTPVKLKTINNIEKHSDYIKTKYTDCHYTNYYHKVLHGVKGERGAFYTRVYHKTKDELFTWLKNNRPL